MIGEVAQSVPVNKNSEKEKLLGSKFPGFYFCMDEPEVLNYKQIIFFIYIYITKADLNMNLAIRWRLLCLYKDISVVILHSIMVIYLKIKLILSC